MTTNTFVSTGSAPTGNRAILFDFDGTLFDATDAIVHAFNTTLDMFGLPVWPRSRVEKHIGMPLIEMFPIAAPGADPNRIDRMIGTYRDIFLPVSVSMTRALPGLRPCLARLREAGFRLGIVTNRGGPGARHILAGFGLSEMFGTIVGVDDVARAKPDAEPVRKALAELGMENGSAVLVGDTPVDMQAAVAAGIPGIGVLTGIHDAPALRNAGAAAVIPDLTHLPETTGEFFRASPGTAEKTKSARCR